MIIKYQWHQVISIAKYISKLPLHLHSYHSFPRKPHTNNPIPKNSNFNIWSVRNPFFIKLHPPRFNILAMCTTKIVYSRCDHVMIVITCAECNTEELKLQVGKCPECRGEDGVAKPRPRRPRPAPAPEAPAAPKCRALARRRWWLLRKMLVRNIFDLFFWLIYFWFVTDYQMAHKYFSLLVFISFFSFNFITVPRNHPSGALESDCRCK